MSILASAGRANIYNTDGTGRDTYVSLNSGGFTVMNQPATQAKSSSFGAVSPPNIRRGGGGSPAKPFHYHTNGTGRDSYIHNNHGGFTSNYSMKNSGEAYVNSLRHYQPSASPVRQDRASRNMTSTLNRKASANKAVIAERDYFTEGQMSIRSPKARYGLNVLRGSQDVLANRLSMPKRASVGGDLQGAVDKIGS